MKQKNTGSYFYNHFFNANFEAPDADLSGRVCIVSGSNTGVGYETALHLIKRNAKTVILAVRTLSKGEDAKKKMLQQYPDWTGELKVWQLNLSSFANVKLFIEKMKNELDRLDILILNAGISTQKWQVTEDGFEESLQSNDLSTGLVALAAIPLLDKTANLPGQTAKPHLVIVGSEGHDWVQPFTVSKQQGDLIEALNDKEQHDPDDRYMTTKLLNVYMAREIANLPAAKNIVVNCPTPGFCSGGLFREFASLGQWFLGKTGWHPEKGARSLIYAALTETEPGAFIWYAKEHPPSEEWVLSEEGQQLQKRFFADMAKVWKRVLPETAGVLNGL